MSQMQGRMIDKEMYIGWEVLGAVRTVYVIDSDAQKPGQHWKLINFGVNC